MKTHNIVIRCKRTHWTRVMPTIPLLFRMIWILNVMGMSPKTANEKNAKHFQAFKITLLHRIHCKLMLECGVEHQVFVYKMRKTLCEFSSQRFWCLSHVTRTLNLFTSCHLMNLFQVQNATSFERKFKLPRIHTLRLAWFDQLNQKKNK